MLVMSLLMGLLTKQANYTASFTHAVIYQDPEWNTMTAEERNQSAIPRGFQTPGHVLKLKKTFMD
jgi:hypothetical protein